MLKCSVLVSLNITLLINHVNHKTDYIYKLYIANNVSQNLKNTGQAPHTHKREKTTVAAATRDASAG